jgi:hypothetical protein
MRKIALFGASALVLALGVASASAIPTTDQIESHGQTGWQQYQTPRGMHEGRAAAIDGSAADSVIVDQHGAR